MDLPSQHIYQEKQTTDTVYGMFWKTQHQNERKLLSVGSSKISAPEDILIFWCIIFAIFLIQ